jgi:hypothetical protein
MQMAAECMQMAAECMQTAVVGTKVDSNGFMWKRLREDIDCSEYVQRQHRQHRQCKIISEVP